MYGSCPYGARVVEGERVDEVADQLAGQQHAALRPLALRQHRHRALDDLGDMHRQAVGGVGVGQCGQKRQMARAELLDASTERFGQQGLVQAAGEGHGSRQSSLNDVG